MPRVVALVLWLAACLWAAPAWAGRLVIQVSARAYLQAEDYDAVIHVCRKALEVQPGTALAENFLGTAHYRKQEYPEAVEHCGRALSLGFRVDPELLKALEPYVPRNDS